MLLQFKTILNSIDLINKKYYWKTIFDFIKKKIKNS